MSERPSSDDRRPVDEHHVALLSLHTQTGEELPDPGLLPGFRRMPTGPALRALAAAPTEEVPISARLGALGSLVRAGLPEWETEKQAYRELAGSVASARGGVDPDQLLSDLKEARATGVPFHTLQSGQALPHHEAAFIGEDVCSTRTVRTGGLEATWVFSEFETDAPFSGVADWVDPRNWPRRGPLLFKAMNLVGGQQPVDLDPPGDPHWHGVFEEEVQLMQRVRTLLHCDFWQDGDRAAGMTYDLALSLDDQIDVDRGFLLVNDVGPVRRVKALKIVGFKDAMWDQVASLVCPFWTDWVRAAVEGGSSSSPAASRPRPAAPEDGTSVCDEWIDFMSESARVYSKVFADMRDRAVSPDLSATTLAEDQRRLFSLLAKDWAQAWSFGMDTMRDVARGGVTVSSPPPPPPRTSATATEDGPVSAFARSVRPEEAGVEGTTVPLADLTPQDSPTVSDLVSIESGGAVIPAAGIQTSVEHLGGGGLGVHLWVAAADLAPGLYVGQVTARAGAAGVPVQLYISRSTGV